MEIEGINYLSYEDILSIYQKTIKVSGGFAGIRDEEQLRSILEWVQSDWYDGIANKAAYLMYRLCSGHFFTDCNKRISLTVTAMFVLSNGYALEAGELLNLLQDQVLLVAAGMLDEEMVKKFFHSIIDHEDLDEADKLEYLNIKQSAIEQGVFDSYQTKSE